MSTRRSKKWRKKPAPPRKCIFASSPLYDVNLSRMIKSFGQMTLANEAETLINAFIAEYDLRNVLINRMAAYVEQAIPNERDFIIKTLMTAPTAQDANQIYEATLGGNYQPVDDVLNSPGRSGKPIIDELVEDGFLLNIFLMEAFDETDSNCGAHIEEVFVEGRPMFDANFNVCRNLIRSYVLDHAKDIYAEIVRVSVDSESEEYSSEDDV